MPSQDFVLVADTGAFTINGGEVATIRTQAGYVALLDALGFRSLVTSDHGNAKVYSYLETIRESLRKSNVGGIESIVFSDSIVLTKAGSEAEDLRQLCAACSQLMFDMLVRGVPVRGAVAYGEYTTSPIGGSAFLAGKPIVDAYDFEQRQNWVGVMLCPSALNQVRELEMTTLCSRNFISSEASAVGLAKYLEWRAYVQFCDQIPFHGSALHQGFAIVPGGAPSSLEEMAKNANTAVRRLEWLKLMAPTPAEQAKYAGTLNWLMRLRDFWSIRSQEHCRFLASNQASS